MFTHPTNIPITGGQEMRKGGGKCGGKMLVLLSIIDAQQQLG